MSESERPLQQRAYSILRVKELAEDKRIIRGIATTPTADRVGDIVVPRGVTFQNPMPLLWQHDHSKPVGTVKFETPTEDGIRFEAELPMVEEAGVLRDRIEEAWQSVKAGLVRAVSIGFRALDHEIMKDGGWRFTKSEVMELSLVTIPANSEATIDFVRAFDTSVPRNSAEPAPAASGKSKRVVKLNEPSRVREPFKLLHVRKPE
jgi:HK97 family phage prohead protease